MVLFSSSWLGDLLLHRRWEVRNGQVSVNGAPRLPLGLRLVAKTRRAVAHKIHGERCSSLPRDWWTSIACSKYVPQEVLLVLSAWFVNGLYFLQRDSDKKASV